MRSKARLARGHLGAGNAPLSGARAFSKFMTIFLSEKQNFDYNAALSFWRAGRVVAGAEGDRLLSGAGAAGKLEVLERGGVAKKMGGGFQNDVSGAIRGAWLLNFQ
jgi:hypothetical protein